MDYKETLDMLAWLSKHVKLSGIDARVIIFISSKANYKTNDVSFSYSELAKSLQTSKQSVMMAIKRLGKVGVIKKLDDSIGRASASYKIRSVDELRLLHESESFNAEWAVWVKKRDELFYDFESQLEAINQNCDECNEERHCQNHDFEIKKMMDSPKGREMRLWLLDNPKPQSHVSKVEFIKINDEKK